MTVKFCFEAAELPAGLSIGSWRSRIVEYRMAGCPTKANLTAASTGTPAAAAAFDCTERLLVVLCF